MSKEYIIESTILVLRGIKFSDYRIRLNPNKQNGGKGVSVIPYLILRFLYTGNDPQERLPFQGIPGHAFERYYFNFRPRKVWFLTCSCFRESTDQYGHHQNRLSWPETVSQYILGEDYDV